MRRLVPYRTEEFIERDAAALLAEYQRAGGIILKPPIPVEDIIEKHLRLRIDFDDMHARHNVPRPASGESDILGAIYDDGSIFIDESLDPEEHPSKEGRYRFTLAHEGGGHWRLHQQLIVQERAQPPLFGWASEQKFVCRSSQAKAREEWQADFYASCLLMPRNMLIEAWRDLVPNGEPRAIREKSRAALFAGLSVEPIPRSIRVSTHIPPSVGPTTVICPLQDMARIQAVMRAESDERALEHFCRPLAERFIVSPTAMRIRLEKLGLLYRTDPSQRLLAAE